MVMMMDYRREVKQFNEYIEDFFKEKQRQSNNTYIAYLTNINMVCKDVFGCNIYEMNKNDIESLKLDVLKRYMDNLINSSKYTNTSINNKMYSIKALIRDLTAHDVIEYDISKLNLIKPLPVDSEETEMIPFETALAYAEYFNDNEKHNGEEKKWATILGFELGNRMNEILSLTRNQLVVDGDTVIVKSKGKNRGKGNKEYHEKIGIEIYKELIKLNPNSDKIFSINYRNMADAFQRANEHFGNELLNYTPHSLKHLAVTLEYRFTNDILAAQRKGKHSSIETTRRYLKIEEIVHVGAYSRMISTQRDSYKNTDLETLISIIDTLPMDIKMLINKKIEEKL